MRDTVRSGKASEQEIRNAASELGNAIGDIAVLASKVRTEVLPAFTPEQQMKVEEFLKEMDGSRDSFRQEFLNQR